MAAQHGLETVQADEMTAALDANDTDAWLCRVVLQADGAFVEQGDVSVDFSVFVDEPVEPWTVESTAAVVENRLHGSIHGRRWREVDSAW